MDEGRQIKKSCFGLTQDTNAFLCAFVALCETGLKVTTFICLAAFMVAFSPGLSAGAESGHFSDNDTLTVSGLGYPPIRAENAAQARLMARRAAVLDAYRNAMAGAGGPNADENTFYTGLSGFVKGMIVEREEYLEDGGVRLFAKVPRKNIAVSQKATRRGGAETLKGEPSPVPLEQWYRIIERSVRFE